MLAKKPYSLAEWIEATAKRALGGYAPSSLRQYSFAYDEKDFHITFKAQVETALSAAEIEGLRVVETEVYAECIFDGKEIIHTVIDVSPSPAPLSPLEGGVIYTR